MPPACGCLTRSRTALMSIVCSTSSTQASVDWEDFEDWEDCEDWEDWEDFDAPPLTGGSKISSSRSRSAWFSSMYSSLMANAWGFGSPASRGYRPSRRSHTWVGVLPAGTSMRTLGAPIASRYDANARTEIHIMNRFYQGS